MLFVSFLVAAVRLSPAMAAIRLQARCRGMRARALLQRLRSAALRLQRFFRRHQEAWRVALRKWPGAAGRGALRAISEEEPRALRAAGCGPSEAPGRGAEGSRP